MSTETPLRQLSEQIWRRRFGDCTIELSWDEWLEMSQEMGRAALAEAERALRERAQSLEVTEAAADVKLEHDEALYIAGEANGWFEAADLLAGMRSCTCDRVDCESCGPRIAKRVME